MLVLSPKKARGARLTGAFDAAGLGALVDGLLSGRVPTTAFQACSSLGWQMSAAFECLGPHTLMPQKGQPMLHS